MCVCVCVCVCVCDVCVKVSVRAHKGERGENDETTNCLHTGLDRPQEQPRKTQATAKNLPEAQYKQYEAQRLSTTE